MLVAMTPGAPEPEPRDLVMAAVPDAQDRSPGLEEGWHNHRVSGIDLFGRHSALSGPARWFQWDAGAGARAVVLRAAAGHARDPSTSRSARSTRRRLRRRPTSWRPPGSPRSVVVRDDVYDEWQADLSDEERAQLVGIRVRWRWPRTHMDHAPRTREFRIYLQPGSGLPPDHALRARVAGATLRRRDGRARARDRRGTRIRAHHPETGGPAANRLRRRSESPIRCCTSTSAVTAADDRAAHAGSSESGRTRRSAGGTATRASWSRPRRRFASSALRRRRLPRRPHRRRGVRVACRLSRRVVLHVSLPSGGASGRARLPRPGGIRLRDRLVRVARGRRSHEMTRQLFPDEAEDPRWGLPLRSRWRRSSTPECRWRPGSRAGRKPWRPTTTCQTTR